MKILLLIFCCLVISCENSTQNIGSNPYSGESIIRYGLLVNTNNDTIDSDPLEPFNKDTIGYNDTFSVFTTLPVQLYRMKGVLRLYWENYHDSSIILISPVAQLSEQDSCYSFVPIDIYRNQDFSLEWKFKYDSMKISNSPNRVSRQFVGYLFIDSIYLDMDTLYGGPLRPIYVPDKRWYDLHDPLDNILLQALYFSHNHISYPMWGSKTLKIYFKR
jgi:hypothetical protein